MTKKSSKSASAGCRVFVICEGPDVKSWAKLIAGALHAQKHLTTNLSDADLVLVVAGQSFMRKPNLGSCRLIKQAFEQDKLVVPVLVDDAKMPKELPADIHKFAYQEAITINSKQEIPGTLARAIAAHYAPVTPIHAAGSSTQQSRTPKQPSVFICYRRDDSGYWADALARALASKVGGDRVFFDVGSQQPGRDYRKQINEALAQCTKFVVVMGPGFLEPNGKGARRIDDERDQVRNEMRSAVATKKPIHVVLSGDAKLPKRRELPADIAKVANTRPLSISRLKSEADADAIAEKIITKSSRTIRSKDKPGYLDKWKLEQQGDQRVIDSLVTKLGNYGWKVVSKRGNWSQYSRLQNNELGPHYTLAHARFPRFRLEVQAKDFEVTLAEHILSTKRLGFPRWATRSVFSISPHTFSTVDMLQLPDNLLEAALDPNQYLNRIGRFDWTKRKRRKMMSQHVFLGNVKYASEPNPSAVEAHQKMRRSVSAHGGLTRLVLHGSVLGMPPGKPAVNAAFHPDGSKLAVVSDSSLHMVSTHDWRVYQSMRTSRYCQSVEFSHQGHIAVGSDKGRIWIWEADGSEIKAAMTPYSLLRRAWDPWASEEIAFTTVSWSDNGSVLAFCGGDGVWTYNIASRQLSCWKFPKRRASNMYYGARFIRGRNELLVYGAFRCLWVLRFPTLKVCNTLELEQRSSRHSLDLSYGRTDETTTIPAFTDIYIAEPSPCGKFVALAGSHGQVAVYDLNSMNQVRILAWHEPFWRGLPSNVKAVSFSPDGKWLASLGKKGELIVGNTRDWEPERSVRVDDWVSRASIAWSADSTKIAVTTSGSVKLWSI